MAPIKNVAVAGASGHLGPALVAALVDSGLFTVTILTRQSQHPGTAPELSPFPSGVSVVPVDYTSLSALTSVLANQDALVSAVPSSPAAVLAQKQFASACIAAGVSHFIPSEFGSDTDNVLSRSLPLFAPKVELQEYLEQIVKPNPDFSYSLVRTNAFLDSALQRGFFVNLPSKGQGVTDIFGSGDQLFSTTTRSTIGKAVVAILAKVDACKNRSIFVHDIALSQRQLLDIAKKVCPSGSWDEKKIDLEEMEKAVFEGKDKDPRSCLKLTVWKEGYGGHFKKVDNDLLGIQGLTMVEVEAMVKNQLES
ncbi:hypothetical protein BP5796_03683 [Coleophoma crateriformis]|uniref:NmrA-like domain-containing protein n=1 Tax=Coleophoma crateriformis TaxID=565419 RepID=A0A3D8SHW5_9HELO|nr:hypothetical protein BP5796_03683 [Coleophoma crateriformis]